MALETWVSIIYETEYGTAPDEVVGENSPITITEEEIPILSYPGFNHVGWMYNGNLVKIGDTIYSDSVETTVTFVAVWESKYQYVDESSGAYKPRLQNNNTDLQKILDTINSLPEGGPQVETCTVTNNAEDGCITYTNAEGNYIIEEDIEYNNSISVLKNTAVYFKTWGGLGGRINASGNAINLDTDLSNYAVFAFFIATGDCSFAY